MCLPSPFPSSLSVSLSDVSNMSVAICILFVLFFSDDLKTFFLLLESSMFFPMLCYSVLLSVVPLLRLYWTCRVLLALRNLHVFRPFSYLPPEPCDTCTLHFPDDKSHFITSTLVSAVPQTRPFLLLCPAGPWQLISTFLSLSRAGFLFQILSQPGSSLFLLIYSSFSSAKISLSSYSIIIFPEGPWTYF